MRWNVCNKLLTSDKACLKSIQKGITKRNQPKTDQSVTNSHTYTCMNSELTNSPFSRRTYDAELLCFLKRSTFWEKKGIFCHLFIVSFSVVRLTNRKYRQSWKQHSATMQSDNDKLKIPTINTNNSNKNKHAISVFCP